MEATNADSRDKGARAHDPLQPSAALLIKLGSIIVHLEEMHSSKGHHYDKYALQTLTNDPIHFKNGHGKVLCSCGKLAAYCSCHESHDNIVIVEKACAECKAESPRPQEG